MLRFSKVMLMAVFVLMAACKKGEPVDEFYFASFTAELLALPGTTTIDAYVDGVKVDSLESGKIIGTASPLMLAAGRESTIAFKKAGTDEVLIDTVVNVTAGDKLALKLACSPELGIQSFISASEGNIAVDTAVFFIFNQLPVELQADDVHVDAFLFKYNGTEYVETGISWIDFAKNKLHPNQTKIQVTAEDGSPIEYMVKLKNSETGEYLSDAFGISELGLYFLPGERQIITFRAMQAFGRWKFMTDTAAY
ncbi:hypothetical protein [Chitinophaga rhizophila]|uniref:Uncharacterized protein n=1 Tax=Chitinophaga rhizophila TaxID=2866212 RepID=A0ABS7GAN6_9BACT|nr:hypothetical protein [Chitinophaga rhizophila]MBW8684200.1 hypothetical protein [Chitinophaga rhizophila]